MTPVTVERHGGRGELVLDRPEARNKITPQLLDGLEVGLAELVADESVGAILLRGAGGTFCDGLDLRSIRAFGSPGEFAARRIAVHAALIDCPKPVVVALEGQAFAAGAALALSGDLMVAGAEAVLWIPEVAIELVAWMNIAILVRRFGPALATELTLDARPYTGRDLEARGLATAVADSEVLAVARATTDRLAAHHGPSLARTKSFVAALSGGGAREYLEEAYRRFTAIRDEP